MNKELFYQKIEDCKNMGYIREIYSSDYTAIFNFGDICYVVCPYILYDNMLPFGVLIEAKDVEDFIKNDGLIYAVSKNLIEKQILNQKAISLDASNLKNIKELIEEGKSKQISSVDYELEERIANANGKGMKK